MNELEQIRAAGIVGCGGAGFPTHVKLNCQVEYLIVNGVECEPLLRTDRWLMKHKAHALVEAADRAGEMTGARERVIVLKESYHEEIASLQAEVKKSGRNVTIFLVNNYYPAGDEQMLVCDVTGRTVPPAGIPLDVGAVVSNAATMYAIYESFQGTAFTHKYLIVTGAVKTPTVLRVPIGTTFGDCLKAAGGITVDDYEVIAGGPLMGVQVPREELGNRPVTKTTSGLIVVARDIPLIQNKKIPLSVVLKRAKSSCIQCRNCTDMCPRYLSGHPLEPHRIMRKMAFAGADGPDLEAADIRQAAICSECGVCEVFACPMGLMPREVNRYIKGLLAQKQIRYSRPEGTDVYTKRPERELRRPPSKRLAARLGVEPYYDQVIDTLSEPSVHRVIIPLKQHIGVPARPLVTVGEQVVCGQLIGQCPEGMLGAFVHASIDGTVTYSGDVIAIEGRW